MARDWGDQADTPEDRVREFLEQRAQMQGIDHKVIYSVARNGNRYELRTEDLWRLLGVDPIGPNTRPHDEHRCTPGNKTIDTRCTWHHEHLWCGACAGYYGVPHDDCHSAQAKIKGEVDRHAGKGCVCRFCELVKEIGWEKALTHFKPKRKSRAVRPT